MPARIILPLILGMLLLPAFAQEDLFTRRARAKQGHAPAQYDLGVAYDRGQGVVQDDSEVVRWYRAAAAQGHAPAQYNLGWMYQNGRGVPRDYQKAVRWYQSAAEQGYASAQNNLGFMYGNGRGVPQDYIQAHAWYNLAASNLTDDDRERAAKNRDAIAEKMPPEQIAEAQRLADDWKPKNISQ